MTGLGRPSRIAAARGTIRFTWVAVGIAAFTVFVCLRAIATVAGSPLNEVGEPGAVAERLIAKGTCPCGCGSQLPSSGHAGACFGCSVGKAEVTFIRESLASGRPLSEILIALRELVLVEVFADYTDSTLPEVWQRTRAAADELSQHRVVLRAPGASAEGLRALAVAECTRGSGRFTSVQSALIAHVRPWDEASLVDLALAVIAAEAEASEGVWTREALRHCAANVDLSAQVERDRQHALERGMHSFPAVSVNRTRTPSTLESIGRAIRLALQQGSI